MARTSLTFYPYKEEILNVITHLVGFVLSLAGLTLLVVFSSLYGDAWHIVSFSIFGTSLVTLYLASTLYHAVKSRKWRRRLNVFDHAAIYVLIAGTYTPFCLVTLNGTIGWVLFGITWGLALIGVILKVFFTGRFNLISTIGYVLMGWVAVIAGKPLLENLETGGLMLLILGGVSYTVGAIFYATERLPYNHAIFHFWVLGGSLLHFFSVLFYVW